MKVFIAVLSDSQEMRDIYLEGSLWISAPVSKRTADLLREAIIDRWLAIKGSCEFSISVFDFKGELVCGKKLDIT